MNKVVVLGAGLMGSQIGCEYAVAGCEVFWVVRSTERAARAISAAFELAERAGLVRSDAAVDAWGRTHITQGEVGGPPPDLVVESIEEQLEAKVAVLQSRARAWPDAIIASNTSSIRIGDVGAEIGAAERTIGTHYWNPPLLMPLVELTPGSETSPAVVERMREQLQAMGKRPVVLQKDVPGFIWNRLQFALLREAQWLVDEGVATPEVVDEVIRDGLARRLRLLGLFETAALGGVATWETVAANLFPQLSDAEDAGTLSAYVGDIAADKREALLRRRDAGLAAALADDRRSVVAGPRV